MISRNLKALFQGSGEQGSVVIKFTQIYISILSILSYSIYSIHIFLWILTFSSPGPALALPAMFRPFVRALEGVDFLEKGLARDPGRRQVPHGDGVHLSHRSMAAIAPKIPMF